MSLVDDADPGDPSVMRRIYEIRGEVRRRDARPNDGRCGNVTAALEAEFGWPGRSGYLRLLDGTVSWVHCWNLRADGTIVDATADQFQGLWLGDVVTLDPSSANVADYLHAPRKWEFRFPHASSSGAEQVECVLDDESHVISAEDADRPWPSLARGALRLLTGWDLDDELVSLAARTLRARAATGEDMSTEELTHPLLIRSIQHIGRQSMPPWIAPEFREPL